MGPGELIYRLRQAVTVLLVVAAARLFPRHFARPDYDIGLFGFFSGGSRMPDLRFDPQVLPDLESLLSGRLKVLGCEWMWDGTAACWHIAPDTGRKWPTVNSRKIPHRPGNPYGDLRVAWEPSRFQHLVSLALRASEAQEDRQSAAWELIARQLASWCEANPFPMGIHYISAMECALRIVALSFILSRFPPDHPEAHRFRRQCLFLIEGHARWIYARISLHSSAGNHTIAECAGLIFAGVLFPEMRSSRRWLDAGLRILTVEAERQILPDGGGIEQAPHYLEFVVDLLYLVDRLLEANDRQTPVEIQEAVRRAEVFLDALGHRMASHLGDSDDGVALSRSLRRSRVRSDKDEHEQCVADFPDSGYSLYASAGPARVHALFDYGALGMAPCYGHGHADCLSFLLEYDGQPILADTGTYTYNGDQVWRRYFKGTSAHNTVCVGGADQAVQVSPFLWKQPFNAARIVRKTDPDVSFERIGRHDGYLDRFGVIHSRVVRAYSATQWVIWDFIDGAGRQELVLNWHIPMQVNRDDRDIEFQSGSLKGMIRINGARPDVISGDGQGPGWWSRSYGMRDPVATVTGRYYGVLPHIFRTEIYLGDADILPEDRLVSDVKPLREVVG